MTEALQEIIAALRGLPPDKLVEVADQARAATGHMRFVPNPGPQTMAWNSKADVTFYGGEAGGGKSGLILGLALTCHQRSLIMRRESTMLTALIDEAIKFNGTRDGYSGKPPASLRTGDSRVIEFGAAKDVGDEGSWQGRPHDFLAFDEVVQFTESQVRFLFTWVRSADKRQRCRIVMASNPPTSPEGMWIVEMFAPWLDETHPNPAKDGELRYFITDERGKHTEVPDGKPIQVGTDERGQPRMVTPLSFTFIRARVDDNPFLAQTDYKAKLDSLQEPYRSAMRDGNFMTSRLDDPWQIIPLAWVKAAQARHRAMNGQPPPGVPMCAVGVDIAQGGLDETVLAMRYDGFYAPFISEPGENTPNGASVASLIYLHRRDKARIILDMGGGYGGSTKEHLENNGETVTSYKGGKGSSARSEHSDQPFANYRTESYWRFREALDPDQPGGSPIMLPDHSKLTADLTSAKYEVRNNTIVMEAKEKVQTKLGRSPDYGDACVMAWTAGVKAATHANIWNNNNGDRPAVRVGHADKKRRR